MADLFSGLKGGRELKRKLKEMQSKFLREMRRALPEEADKLMAQASAPQVSGALEGSESVVSSSSKGKVDVAAGYTDRKAAAVHEGVHWGDKVEGTRGFKWFEREFQVWEPQAIARIVARLRALTREGGNSPKRGAGAKKMARKLAKRLGKLTSRGGKHARRLSKAGLRRAKRLGKAGLRSATRAGKVGTRLGLRQSKKLGRVIKRSGRKALKRARKLAKQARKLTKRSRRRRR